MANIVRVKQSLKKLAKDHIEELFPKIDVKTFIGILIFGFVVHSFRITQMLNAADDIFVLMKGFGTGIESGRWALEYLGNLVNWKWQLGSFNLSVFDGLVSLVLLSLSACIILELFQLRRSKWGILFAAVFIVYPTCSATFVYMFTAAYYSLSCLLAVLAAYYIKTRKILYGLFAVVCIAVSTGLYQAYFPVTVTLCLLLLADYFMREDADLWKGIRTGLYYLLVMCLGLITYFLVLYDRLAHFGKELFSYKGLDSIGKLSAQEAVGLVGKCYDIFAHLPAEVYHSINTLPITRMCILILYVFSILGAVVLIVKKRKNLSCIMIVPLMLLLPVAVNLIEIMSKSAGVYELMVYPTVFIFFLPVLLFERVRQTDSRWGGRWPGRLSGAVLSLTLVLVVLCYSWHANWNYVALDYMNRETESYFTTLVTRIKSAEHYRDEYPVLFVGENSFADAHFSNPYSVYPELYYECNPPGLIYVFSWRNALSAYTGFQCDTPSQEQCEEIYGTEEFKAMASYPDDGSVKVIRGVVVVKIAE